ncbi:MAG: ABC transporter ATP-binding protein [Chloroflexota bacterium]
MKALVRALSFMRPYWPSALGAFASMLLVSVAHLISPQLIRYAIDNGIVAGNPTAIILASAILVAVALARGLFSFLQGYLSERASQGAAYDLRNLIYGRLQTLSFSFHDQAQTGQLMTRVTSDVEMVRQFTGQGALQLVSAILGLVGTAVVLVLMNWRLAVFALATLPLMLISFAFFIRRAHPLFNAVQQRLATLNTILQENLAGVRVIKAFVREDYEAARYDRANEALLEKNVQVVRTFSTAFPLTFFIASLGTLAVIWFGGNQVISGEITIGELVAFNTYLGLLMFPAFILGMMAAIMARATASARRIFEVVDAQNEVMEKPDALDVEKVRGRVVFEEVSFRYVGMERDVLDRVSFVAEPGQTVAIVGTTGSGKTTIINLIPRFYDVTHGRVMLDGHDVRDLTLVSLRRHIGIVLQETLLFSGTIKENLAYGAPDASFEDIERVARLAQAHDFIVEQPNGYETRIGEGGVGLSGGQMQRIAIARALLLEPNVLILDDSTSSVDAETEYQIQRSLDELMKERTSFIIAQRMSTVRNADVILVLDQARIAASGTHEELLASNDLYADIVTSQLRDDVPAPDGAVAPPDKAPVGAQTEDER